MSAIINGLAQTRITLYATDGVPGGTATVTGVTIAAVEM